MSVFTVQVKEESHGEVRRSWRAPLAGPGLGFNEEGGGAKGLKRLSQTKPGFPFCSLGPWLVGCGYHTKHPGTGV